MPERSVRVQDELEIVQKSVFRYKSESSGELKGNYIEKEIRLAGILKSVGMAGLRITGVVPKRQ